MEHMKISVCLTVLNEQLSIKELLNSLLTQTLKPNEIIVIDGGSSDKTVKIVKKYKSVRVIVKKNVSRSVGRNIAIQLSKNKYIAMTDAGCIPHKDWLLQISKSFKDKNTDVVAGSYRMIFDNSLQKSMSVYLGTDPKNINQDFIPSARSMAFTKDIWKKVGGFSEKMNNTAEDTLFNYNLQLVNAKFVVNKKAIVDWYMPNTIFEFALKIYSYAKGDVQSGIWWDKKKKFRTHNLKAISIFIRYILFITLLYINLNLCLLFFVLYMLYAFSKAGIYGVILQFTSDFAVIIGFINGILQPSTKGN